MKQTQDVEQLEQVSGLTVDQRQIICLLASVPKQLDISSTTTKDP
jgi:hypothetical protein